MKTLPFFLVIGISLISYTGSIPPLISDDPISAFNDIDFIRSSCSATLYPDPCYASLIGYADAIQQDPSRLALAAIRVSLEKAHHMTEYVSNLTRQAEYGSDRRASSALQDCISNFGEAVDKIRDSLKQMRQAVSTGSDEPSFRFQISNIQTLMRTALTDEETCTDGFGDVGDGQMKSDVCDRSEDVRKATSNALALVNSYADKGIHH